MLFASQQKTKPYKNYVRSAMQLTLSFNVMCMVFYLVFVCMRFFFVTFGASFAFRKTVTACRH